VHVTLVRTHSFNRLVRSMASPLHRRRTQHTARHFYMLTHVNVRAHSTHVVFKKLLLTSNSTDWVTAQHFTVALTTSASKMHWLCAVKKTQIHSSTFLKLWTSHHVKRLHTIQRSSVANWVHVTQVHNTPRPRSFCGANSLTHN